MKTHILIVADGRSPTAQSWINNVRALDFQVSLISTFPCEQLEGLAHFHILPIAFSRFSSGKGASGQSEQKTTLKSWIKRLTPLIQTLRYHLGPLTLSKVSSAYQELVEEIQPDLVHALRIPFEGMLASQTPEPIPLLVAIWGNDLTLHAKGSLSMKRWTHSCLKRADGLSADTQRDIRLAKDWGFKPDAPTLVVPGSGGLDLAAIQKAKSFEPKRFSIPESAIWIVNPRGLRPGSVHQKVFFTAIPKILAQRPETVFICPGLKGSSKVAGWIQSLGIGESTKLLPHLPQEKLWSMMKGAPVFVSPSSHDGTPNSFLEAMACGCFPIVGDIESLREWVQHGENGLLVNPKDPKALAAAILWALAHPEIWESAAEKNQTVIKEKAAQEETRPKIDAFYSKFLS